VQKEANKSDWKLPHETNSKWQRKKTLGIRIEMQLSNALLVPGRTNDSATLQVDVKLQYALFVPRMFMQAAVAVDDAGYVELGPHHIPVPQIDIGASKTTINHYTFFNSDLLDMIRSSKRQVTLRINGSTRESGSAYVHLSTSRIRRKRKSRSSTMFICRDLEAQPDQQKWSHQPQQQQQQQQCYFQQQHQAYGQPLHRQQYDPPVMLPSATVKDVASSNDQPHLSALLKWLNLPKGLCERKSSGDERHHKSQKTRDPCMCASMQTRDYCPTCNWTAPDACPI
jgi:hypothetical protein